MLKHSTLPPALLIADLSKTYANGVEALCDINLSVAPGEFFGLLGPNGAGKTTLIGSFTGLVNKTGGSIAVLGHDVDTATSKARACISLMPQEFNVNIFKSVKRILTDNAGYYGVPYRVAKQRAEYWLKQLGLWDKRDKKPTSLSGGMKRRLMLARAMMHDPKILVLDEPTAGVDLEVRLSLWELVRKINRDEGVTIVLTTHYLEEAENLCHRVAIIDKGRIIEDAPIDTLLEKVNTERFILNLAEPVAADVDIAPFDYQVLDTRVIEVTVNKGQSINKLFTVLSNNNVAVHSIKNKRNRLEQLFIELTGE